MPLEKHKALEQPYVFWKHVLGVTTSNCNGSQTTSTPIPPI